MDYREPDVHWVGSAGFRGLTPLGAVTEHVDTASIRRLIAEYPVEAVLATCSEACAAMALSESSILVIPEGPLRGCAMSPSALGYVARQALAACPRGGIEHSIIPPALYRVVETASVHTMYHEAMSLPSDGTVSLRWALGMALGLQGWQDPYQLNFSREIPRTLLLFQQRIPESLRIGERLGDAFALAVGLPYEKFLAIGHFLLVTSLAYRYFTVEHLAWLWERDPWQSWCRREDVETVLGRISLPLAEQRRLSTQAFGEEGILPDSPYAFNPLVTYPLVQVDDEHFIAPVPFLVLHRATQGATFDVTDHFQSRKGNIGRIALGYATEGYVGQLLGTNVTGSVMLPEIPYRIGKQEVRGPDFAVVHGDDLLLIEVKSAQPSVRMTEHNDVEELGKMLERAVIEPLRKLPSKERMMLQEDKRLRRLLPSAPKRVIHVVVTLGEFHMQRWWWSGLATALLQSGSDSDKDPTYDVNTEHHLLSVAEIEHATTSGMPPLTEMLREVWTEGLGEQLSESLRRQTPPLDEREHPLLVPEHMRWRAAYSADVLPTATKVPTNAPKLAFPSFGSPVAAMGTEGPASASTVYTDPRGRFSFTVPDGYQETPIPPQQQGMVISRFASTSSTNVLLINIQGMESYATLDLKTKAVQNTLSRFPDYQSLTPDPVVTTVAGQGARQIEFLATQGGIQYHVLSVSTVRGVVFYTLGLNIEAKSYATNIEQAKVFLNTFRFLP